MERTSAGSSAEAGDSILGGVSGALDDTSEPASDAGAVTIAPFSAIVSLSASPTAGVPTLVGGSDSSSMAKAPSNSDGSGPLDPSSSTLTLGRGLLSLARAAGLRLVEGVRAGEEGSVLSFACSSAIRWSIAPFSL